MDSPLSRLVALDPFPQPEIIRLRYPVVLMHGFGMLASLRRQGHMHDLAMSLRARGVLAFAPNVPPYNPVPVRAKIWRERIESILNQTGSDRLILIAHSMGGLDARYLISKLGFARHVSDLVTIATPHHGSSLANFVLEQPDRLTVWLADIANWMGSAVMKEVEADFLNTISELTPDHMATSFNAEITDHPGVRYWSYSGQAGREAPFSISPFLRPLNYILFNREGLNDGFVSVESAQWGTYLGSINADHAQQLGFQFPSKNPFRAEQFFIDTVQRISEQESEEEKKALTPKSEGL